MARAARIIPIILVLFLSLSLAGQEAKDQTVPPLRHEVVVSATRIETPVREIASAVTVLTRRELDRTSRTNILDVIQDGLGVSAVRNGGPGAASSVFLRGANSEHVLVLLDGVSLNDPMNPSRSFDLAHLSLDNVERIEILRGPQSTLYGSDALAGVVNIVSRRGAGKPSISLETSAGSYGTLHSSASAAGGAGRLAYSFGLSHILTRGFSAASTAFAGNTEPDGYRNLSLSGNLGWTISPSTEAGLALRIVDARSDIDGFGGTGGDDPNSRQDYRSQLVSARGRTLLFDGRWELKASASYLGAGRDNSNPVDALHPFDSETGRFRSRLFKIDAQNNLFLSPAQTLTFGGDWQREEGESSYRSESAWGPYDSAFPGRDAERAGVFAQDQLRLGGVFFATAGVRLDSHSRTGTSVTYRIAPALAIDATGTRFKATLGTGFKSPSLYQLFAPGTAWGPIGNDTLRPERSTGWDAGIEQALAGGRILAGLTWFRNDFRDLVDFDYSLGYINIGRARTEGLEAFARFQPSETVDLRLSYTRMNARDLDAGTALLRRPKDKAVVEAYWRPLRQWEIRVSAAYVGSRADRDYSVLDTPAVTLRDYFLADADLAFQAGPRTRLFLRLDNLFDERYETVFGYGTPRLSAYGGVRLGIGR
ncbi:MAG: TonB-dependent receptor [Candidatus Aminicenantes bacterium]|nr:TonB-dependent receptor [Candidatus Aminicenantes bacterium]